MSSGRQAWCARIWRSRTGIIVEIGPEVEGSATVEIDADGLHVFPGGVDPHVHLNDPGTDWEGFASGTAAFAAGGGTCLFDMPLNASPPTLDGASFDLKLEAARGRAHTDFCLWGGLVPGDVDRLDELAERGVVGFKAFMCDTGMEEFPAADDLTLYEGMARAARLGLPVAVHAESDAITRASTARARRGGPHVDARLSRLPPADRRARGRRAARSSSPRRPAARSTSFTSAPPRRPCSSPRPAPAAST